MALVSWAPWRPDGRNEDMSLETLAIVLETYYLDVNEKTTAEGRKMLCFSCDVTGSHVLCECLYRPSYLLIY